MRKSKEGQTHNLSLGTPAAQKSPIAGPFETNQNALVWVLQSPEGKRYDVWNLAKFVRDNPDLFDGTPQQARSGIYQIRRTILGTRGKSQRDVHQWKGWRLIHSFIPLDT